MGENPIDAIFNNPKQVCARCSREKVIANLKHTRLYGYLCVCGSDEWVDAWDEDVRTGEPLKRNMLDKYSTNLFARSLRISIVQQEYNKGTITEEQAREILRARLNPKDKESQVDDSGMLLTKE